MLDQTTSTSLRRANIVFSRRRANATDSRSSSVSQFLFLRYPLRLSLAPVRRKRLPLKEGGIFSLEKQSVGTMQSAAPAVSASQSSVGAAPPANHWPS